MRALGNHADLTGGCMNATTQLKTDELINLEREVSEGRDTPALLRRLERLKRKHQKDALGRVAKALQGYEFRDDVLHTAHVRDGKHLGECAKDPQWATVEVLDLGWNTLRGLGIPISDFLDAMPLLHTLSIRAAQLPERPCPGIATLSVTGEVTLALLAERFPGINKLELGFISRPEDLWAHPLVGQLESITLGALTWTEDVLRLRPGQATAYAEWIAKGPPLRRLEIQEEDVFGSQAACDLQELFDAARRKGADVVLLPEPEPRAQWRSWRRERYDRWH